MDSTPPPDPARKGRAGSRRTSLRVRAADRAAELLITIGGMGVIAAVAGIFVFLCATVLPLFEGGRVTPMESVPPATTRTAGASVGAPLFGMADEYRSLMTTVTADGIATTRFIPTGAIVAQQSLLPDPAAGGGAAGTAGPRAVCWSFARERGRIATGYSDGSVQISTLGFEVGYVEQDDRTEEVRALPVGGKTVVEGGYVEHAALDQFRGVRPAIEVGSPTILETGSGGVVRINAQSTAETDLLVAVREDGSAELSRVRTVRPLGGGKPRTSLESTPFKLVSSAEGIPDWIFVTGDGASVITLWASGEAQRYAVIRGDDGPNVVAADRVRLTDEGRRITAAQMLLGSKTLMLGTADGRVIGAFAARDVAAPTPDHLRLVAAHEFDLSAAGAGEITRFAISQRDRSFAAGDLRGGVFLRHMTSGKSIIDLPGAEGRSAVAALEITPKVDGLIAVDSGGDIRAWALDPKFAEAGVKSLFGKVWYEGEPAPSYSYQSSSGEDTAEPKLSLVPLIFGTLKATVYAMLFAVPLAILAAMYTSEMLHPRVRNRVKPVVEAMASLPSVVLGFIAALIVAPFARDWLPSILIAFFVIPSGALLAGLLWQMLPIRIMSRLTSLQHFMLAIVVLIVGIGVSAQFGPVVERLLFSPSSDDVLALAGSYRPADPAQVPEWARDKPSLEAGEIRLLHAKGLYFRQGEVVTPTGSLSDPAVKAAIEKDGLDRADIRLWLDGIIGGAWPGWMLLMLVPGIALALVVRVRIVDPWLRGFPSVSIGPRAARFELVKFFAVWALAVGIAAALASMLTAMGLDPRDSVFGPFNQRNSLVVGLIMGFAVIPIIYTVSEDALSSVPVSLRSASLGAGATRWQTAVRVVLPVAASGIFSACMIGLGRAAGETMIVVMATGNTPNMDWSMFSGFRTLAANIAVELPEAVRDGTHYRVLFLCGLVLFFLTGVVNTAAELVRQRFRKRGAGL